MKYNIWLARDSKRSDNPKTIFQLTQDKDWIEWFIPCLEDMAWAMNWFIRDYIKWGKDKPYLWESQLAEYSAVMVQFNAFIMQHFFRTLVWEKWLLDPDFKEQIAKMFTQLRKAVDTMEGWILTAAWWQLDKKSFNEIEDVSKKLLTDLGIDWCNCMPVHQQILMWHEWIEVTDSQKRMIAKKMTEMMVISWLLTDEEVSEIEVNVKEKLKPAKIDSWINKLHTWLKSKWLAS